MAGGWRRIAVGIALVAAVLPLTGCTRTRYRLQADEEAGHIILEKSDDARWAQPDFTIEMDPRSRYYDPWDRDRPPMPPDDPASHEYMHSIDGMRGWSHWHDNGDIDQLENPYWQMYLDQYAEHAPDGSIRLRLENAVRLALMHSPTYQQQLETLYLSALDVSTERFRFDVQFYGNSAAAFQHLGSERAGAGGESNTVTLNPGTSPTSTELLMRRRFATAGELLVGFANSTVWEFFGPNTGFTTSILNFNLVQPLLRAGGRVVALEQLTIAERGLLANLRAFQRYRQGFYTQVAIGESSVGTLQRRGGFFGGTGLTGFTGQGSGGFGGVGDVTGFGRGNLGTGGTAGGGSATGFAGGGAGTIGGFIGLLQQLQQIRNTQEALNAELRTLSLLEANLEAGFIDIAQVDQFRQNIETERANLLQASNALQSTMDGFKSQTLGLPPSLEISLDDSFIRPFQFTDPQISDLQNRIAEGISSFGVLPAEPPIEKIQQAFDGAAVFEKDLAAQFIVARAELKRLESFVSDRERSMNPTEKRLFAADRRRLAESLAELETRVKSHGEAMGRARSGLTPATRQATADRFVALLVELSNIAGELSLIQGRAKLEGISVEPIDLESQDALAIARANRLDWMNNRAAVVDTWRLIEFNANALKSDLTVRFSGDLQTLGGDNPLKFRDETGSLRAQIQFDPPFTRLIERNNFRQQLISYQQDRRQLIQFEDSVNRSVRQLLRDQKQLRTNLEIQRRAVAIAIRRVDQTREVLNKPVPPAVPGAPPAQFGPTASLNLLTALSDLRNTQNNFMSVWINHHAGRMRLLRELGLMQIGDDGLWIEESIDAAIRRSAEEEPLPPDVPREWLQEGPTGPAGQGPQMPPAPTATNAVHTETGKLGRAVLIPDDASVD